MADCFKSAVSDHNENEGIHVIIIIILFFLKEFFIKIRYFTLSSSFKF